MALILIGLDSANGEHLADFKEPGWEQVLARSIGVQGVLKQC